MVSIAQIRSSNARIVVETEEVQPNIPGVAVFIGGTAGIGRATIVNLIKLKAPLRVYIIGRNGARHATFLEELRAWNQQAEIIWLEGEITLLAEVKRLCEELQTREKHIDLLHMSAGYMPFSGRDETTEGLDKAMVLRYWSRILFVVRLLPLLRANPRSNTTYKSRIISVLAAGYETASLPLDDLGLTQPGNFTVAKMIATDATMTTLTFSRLAQKSENRSVVFIHHNPGPVETNILRHGWREGSWEPKLLSLAWPIMRILMRSIDEAGERLLYIITSRQYGGTGVAAKNGETMSETEAGDVYLVDKNQECIFKDKVFIELREKKASEAIQQKTEEILNLYY